MAQARDEDKSVMQNIDRLCNLAIADNWLVDKAIKRLKTFKTPIESDRTYSAAKAVHDKMIVDTQKCGNSAAEARDCLQYFSDEFSPEKNTIARIKVNKMGEMITKTIEESNEANIRFERDEEFFLAEREKVEREERRVAEEKRQVAEAAASVLATARATAAALNPPNPSFTSYALWRPLSSKLPKILLSKTTTNSGFQKWKREVEAYIGSGCAMNSPLDRKNLSEQVFLLVETKLGSLLQSKIALKGNQEEDVFTSIRAEFFDQYQSSRALGDYLTSSRGVNMGFCEYGMHLEESLVDILEITKDVEKFKKLSLLNKVANSAQQSVIHKHMEELMSPALNYKQYLVRAQHLLEIDPMTKGSSDSPDSTSTKTSQSVSVNSASNYQDTPVACCFICGEQRICMLGRCSTDQREPCSKTGCKQKDQHNIQGHNAYNEYCKAKSWEHGSDGYTKRGEKEKKSKPKKKSSSNSKSVAAVIVTPSATPAPAETASALPGDVIMMNSAKTITGSTMEKMAELASKQALKSLIEMVSTDSIVRDMEVSQILDEQDRENFLTKMQKIRSHIKDLAVRQEYPCLSSVGMPAESSKQMCLLKDYLSSHI